MEPRFFAGTVENIHKFILRCVGVIFLCLELMRSFVFVRFSLCFFSFPQVRSRGVEEALRDLGITYFRAYSACAHRASRGSGVHT